MEQPPRGRAVVSLPTPVLAIRHAICFFCLESFPQLSKCSACKRVSYCSKQCQKKDWQRGHQKTCKVLIASNKRKIVVPRAGRTWDHYCLEKWSDIEALTSQIPPLDENHRRLFMYEPFCRHCYRSAPNLGGNHQLRLCQKCHLASFCPECPLSHPSTECETFHDVEQDEKFLIKYHEESGNKIAIFPTEQPRHTYLPLSAASGWYDYYTRISDKTLITSIMTPDMRPVTGEEEVSGSLRLASGTTSLPLTILAALETEFLDIATRSSIKLHLIGATTREIDALIVFEELLHLLPSLKSVDLTLVGYSIPPESVGPAPGQKPLTLGCCDECTSLGRTRSISLWRGAYHDYAKKDSYQTPDLAVAFHTGFSQEAQNDWLPTVRELANAPYPTMFTTYNETEMKEETTILTNMGAKFSRVGELNKWRGLCPILEVIEKPNTVYYPNQYWYIVAGRT